MGYRELIEAITREGEEKIAQLRREAGAEGERIRASAAAGIEVVREEASRRLAAATAEAMGEAEVRGVEEGRRIRIEAEQALAERLYRLARCSLGRLRVDPDRLFTLLAAELPAADWERVAVNPADRAVAGRTFPGAAIVDEPAITGGCEAEAEGGRIRIVNTLEKRLERGWPELLPEIVRSLTGDGEGPWRF